MLIFIYGADSYRSKQYRQELIERYKAKYSSGINLFSFDLSDDSSIGELESAIKSSSFFNEHKLIICVNSFQKKNISDKVFGLIKDEKVADVAEITFLVTENLPEKELLTKNKEFFKYLSGVKNVVKSFESLNGPQLAKWVGQEFERRGSSIKSSVAAKLIDITGPDSSALINEIEKLTAYKSGGEVSAADINLLVSSGISLNIFNLIDAIGGKNRIKSAELLYQELKTGRDPYYILTMIIYQFRNLLVVRDLKDRGFSDAEVVSKSKLHPFVVKKMTSGTFEMNSLKKIYAGLSSMDTGFKAGRQDIEDSLYKLVLLA